MKKQFCITVWALFLFMIMGGGNCAVKTCPPQYHNYNLHNLTERGFAHIFTIETDCTGCHHISAERCGLVKIEKEKTDKNGVFIGKIRKIKGSPCKKDRSTFFPERWSIQTTLDKIEEARNNIIDKTYNTDTNEREVTGKTSENITIKIIFDKQNPKKIFNAYPIFEQTSESDD